MLHVELNKDIEVALVLRVPLAPFVSMRDGSIDGLSLNKLASFGRRSAYHHGWILGLNSTFPAHQASTISEVTTVPRHTRTVFLVAQLVVTDDGPDVPLVPSRLDQTCTVRCCLTACGQTSYTVLTEVFLDHNDGGVSLPAESHPTTHAVRLGYAIQKFVSVDIASRRPHPIAPAARESALLALQRSPPPVWASLERLSSYAVDVPDFDFHSTVRPFSDVDFNGHVNQGVIASLPLDALAALVQSGDVAHMRPELRALADGQREQKLVLSTLRIDYLKEVSVASDPLTTSIWYAPQLAPAGRDTAAAPRHTFYFQISSQHGTELQVIHAIGVLTLAL